MSDTKPHWRGPGEIAYVGDRIVAICRWSDRRGQAAKPHVITLTIDEDGVTRDNEDLGHCLEDCDHWMPEAEFLKLFGPEVQADAPPNATPWQQADGWEGRQ